MSIKHILTASVLTLGITWGAGTEYVKESYHPYRYVFQTNIYEAQKDYDAFFKDREFQKGDGHKGFIRWYNRVKDRADANGDIVFKATPQTKFAPPPVPGQVPATWNPIGPKSWDYATNTGWNPGVGRLNTIALDPNNSNIIYVGAPEGGAWKSTDGGQSWKRITDAMENRGVSAILIDPRNSNVVYLGTGDNAYGGSLGTGVWKSTDGGQSWNQLTGMSWSFSENKTVTEMRFQPGNPDVIAVSTNFGVYLSKNAGDTWSRISTIADYPWVDVEFLPGASEKLIIAATQNFAIYDVGTGSTQTMQTDFYPTGTQRVEMSVSQAASKKVYLLFQGSGTVNGKAVKGVLGLKVVDLANNSVTTLTEPGVAGYKNMFGYGDGNDLQDEGWYYYNMALKVSDTDPNDIFLGGVHIWKSLDGGSTWTRNCYWSSWEENCYVHADIHELSFQDGKLWAACDGGIYVTSDQGQNFQDLSKGIQIAQFYGFDISQSDSLTMTGGTQDIGVFTNRSGTWTTTAGGDAYGGFIDRTNDDIIYYSYKNTYRSTNQGQSYSQIFASLEIQEFDQHPQSPLIMIAGEKGTSKLHRSTNGGLSWNSVYSASGGAVNAISFCQSNPDIVYASAGAKVLKSTNVGVSWSVVNSSLSGTISGLACDAKNPDRIWISLSGFRTDKAYISTNGGSTLQNYSQGLPAYSALHLVHDFASNGGVYVGTENDIWYRNDTLDYWVNFSQGIPFSKVQKLRIFERGRKLRAATFGRGIWESDLFDREYTEPSSSAVELSSKTEQSSLGPGDL